jgi:hypothetical protein
MKFLIACILVLNCSLVSLAQMGSRDSSFFEIGLNATAFVNQYLDFGSGNGEFSSPFILTLERRFGKAGIRMGLAADGARDKQEPENGQPTSPVFNIAELQLNARAGVVLYQNLSPRWDLKYGCDIAFGYDNRKNWTEVTNFFGQIVKNTNTDLVWNLGLNPYLFAQFHLNEKFSLGTELIMNLSYTQSVEKIQSSEFPQFDVRQESNGMRYSINPPIALFFIFRI